MPETLHEAYENLYNTIQQLKGSTPALIEKALMWLLCSQNPLKPQDWEIAVQWTAEMDSLDGLPIGDLLHICRYLVQVDTDSGYVRFTHLFVREFLETRFLEGDAHYTVAEVCTARFLRESDLATACIFSGPYQAESRDSFMSYHRSNASLSSPTHHHGQYNSGVYKYTLENWILHIALAVYVHGVTKSFVHVSAFLRHMSKPESWGYVNDYRDCKFLNPPTFLPHIPLYIVAYLGIDPSKMGLWSPLNFDHHKENTHLLLCAAVEWGNEAMTRLILGHGAVDMSLNNYLWGSLTLAILKGYVKVAQIVYSNCLLETSFPAGYAHRIVSEGEFDLKESFQRSFKVDVSEDLLVAALNRPQTADILRFFWRPGDMANIQEAVLIATVKKKIPSLDIINLICDFGNFKLTESLFAAAITYDLPIHKEIILKFLSVSGPLSYLRSYLM